MSRQQKRAMFAGNATRAILPRRCIYRSWEMWQQNVRCLQECYSGDPSQAVYLSLLGNVAISCWHWSNPHAGHADHQTKNQGPRECRCQIPRIGQVCLFSWPYHPDGPPFLLYPAAPSSLFFYRNQGFSRTGKSIVGLQSGVSVSEDSGSTKTPRKPRGPATNKKCPAQAILSNLKKKHKRKRNNTSIHPF
jgi:hypothetical protein